jgi:hypothetical protein
VGQQWGDCILDLRLQRAARYWPPSHRFLANRNQKLIEVGVCGHNRDIPDGPSESNFVDPGVEFDFPVEKCRELGYGAIASMGDSHAGRHEMAPRQMPAKPHQYGQADLNLMPAGVAGHADKVKDDPDISSLKVLDR